MSKIALVTGGTRGLGLATARRLGEVGGFRVVIGARDPRAGERTVRALGDERIDADLLLLDVTDPASVQAAAKRLDDRYGRLDVLVNNAGVLPEATEGSGNGPVDVDLFKRTFDTNLFGAVSVVQHFLPRLRRSAAGRIVNVSSTMGSLADQGDPASPYFGVVVPAYQGSKAALNALTVALAKALADTAIKVNSVCPGWLQTDLGGPDNRAAAPTTAAEGAEVVVAMACLRPDGPTGAFVDRAGPVRW
jgi:NAD(P)-dependent dehydrogenase (short-subunit alcohol dehydrogenase family)